MAVPPAPDRRSDDQQHPRPPDDTSRGSRSATFRVVLLGVLVLALARRGRHARLAARDPPRRGRRRAAPARGRDGRRAVHAPAQHLRPRPARRHGPDAEVPRAGRRGDHAQVQDVLREGVAAAEQTVAKAGLSRDGQGLRDRGLHDRRRLRDRARGRLLHRLLPRRQGRRSRRVRAVPHRGQPGEDQGHLAGRRLHPCDGSREVQHAPAGTTSSTSPRTPPSTEIRAAWRAALADLDPTDRPFRVFNQAAEALLDRSAARRTTPSCAPPRRVPPTSARRGARPAVATPTLPRGATALSTGSDAPGAGRTVPAWLLAVLAVLTAIAVAACAGWSTTRPSDPTVDASHPQRPERRRARDRADPVLQLQRRGRSPEGRGVVPDLGLPHEVRPALRR